MEANKELINKFYQPITINLKEVGRHNNSNQMWENATACASIAEEYARERSVGFLDWVTKEAQYHSFKDHNALYSLYIQTLNP